MTLHIPHSVLSYPRVGMSSSTISHNPPLVQLHSDGDLDALRKDFREIIEKNLDAAANTVSASRLATVSLFLCLFVCFTVLLSLPSPPSSYGRDFERALVSGSPGSHVTPLSVSLSLSLSPCVCVCACLSICLSVSTNAFRARLLPQTSRSPFLFCCQNTYPLFIRFACVFIFILHECS